MVSIVIKQNPQTINSKVNIAVIPLLTKVVNQLNNITDIVIDPGADGVGQSFVVYDVQTGKFVVQPIELEGGDF